jgi:hypothetical protein
VKGPESNMTGVLTKQPDVCTDMHTGRLSWEDEGRDPVNASTCQGMRTAAATCQKLGRGPGTGSFSQRSEDPALLHLHLNFWPPE